MKKRQINKILVKQAKRRNTIFLLTCIIAIIFIFTSLFFGIFLQRNKNYYVKYNEQNNTNFSVNLKENDFFKNNYLGENNEYISTLIENVKTNFKYNLSLEEGNVSYKYSYRIEANINVKSKGSNKNLFNKNEILLNTVEKTTSKKDIAINEELIIDYNYYNNLAKKFVSVYSLEEIESTLNVIMYIDVVGNSEKFKQSNYKESMIAVNIPLTSKVLNIEITDDLIKNHDNLIQCKNPYNDVYIFLIMTVIFVILQLISVIYTINYILKTRTAENIYEKELKKILNNYGSYIQILNNEFNFKEYQILIIETFNDMLEIRDTIGQPILMKENNEKNGAYFIIPSNTKMLYIYRLKVNDIEKRNN